MIDYDAALAVLRGAVLPLASERIAVEAGAGRVLAEPVVAALSSPRSDVATRDGYAIRHSDYCAGAPLRVIGTAAAGAAAEDAAEGAAARVGAGEAMRIFTGARLPAGADRVVMQEDVARVEGGSGSEAGSGVGGGAGGGAGGGDDSTGHIAITSAADPERHIRRAGSDFAAGDVLIDAGTWLTPQALVAAAGADRGALCVTRRPRVAIIATGDELAAPGQAMRHDRHIPDSITPALAACVARWGGVVTQRVRLGDDLPRLITAAGAAIAAADVLVITGGASVGARDHAKAMVAPHGMVPLFSTVAMRPGKPVWCGRADGGPAGGAAADNAGARACWVIGLPGNPTSAMVTARLLLAPLIAGLLGQRAQGVLVWRSLPLAAPLPPTGARETFVRALWGADGLVPVTNQDSGAQAALAAADWLIRCPPGQAALAAGAMVRALPL